MSPKLFNTFLKEGTIWKTKTRQDDDNTDSSEDNYSHLVVADEDEHNIFDMLGDM